MKNILFIICLFYSSVALLAQDATKATTKRIKRQDKPLTEAVKINPVLLETAVRSNPNDTIAMPGATKDKRLVATFQPLVAKRNIKYSYTSSKAPNSDGTHWYSTFGEGRLNWNANGTKLMGKLTRYFSDRQNSGQRFDKNSGETMDIEIDATNQKVTLKNASSNVTYTTEIRNGLIYGFNMSNEIIIITLDLKGIQ